MNLLGPSPVYGPVQPRRQEVPARTVVLSAHYYDAASTNREADFGRFLGAMAEDYYFHTAARYLVLARIRREIRNNPYLAGLVNKFPEAVGFSNLRSRTSQRAYNEQKDAWWFRWAKRVTPAGDSLRTIEEIVHRELLIAGEVFLVKLANGRVQLIPSEFCGSPTPSAGSPSDLADGEYNGIVYRRGQPIAYRFGRMTTAGSLTFDQSTLIDARHVIHVFQKDRVLMGRGLPWLLPSLRPAHDLYEITRAKTKQIKDANSISGVIEKQGAAKFLEGLGGPGADVTPEPESSDAPADQSADPDKADKIVIELAPGTLVALEPGEKLNQLKAEYQATDYKELIMLQLHAIATPVGLPVELWFSGLGNVAYSGFKGLGTQWNARRQYLLAFTAERLLNPLHEWRAEKATAEADLPANPDGDHDLIDWAFRRTSVLDEEKEAKANQVRLSTGEVSLADIWEEKGFYAEEVFAARRDFWIKLQVAAGELEEGADHTAVKVPMSFLLRGELPGETTYPRLPHPADPTDTGPAPSDDSSAAAAA